jgi:hypothetical protein
VKETKKTGAVEKVAFNRNVDQVLEIPLCGILETGASFKDAFRKGDLISMLCLDDILKPFLSLILYAISLKTINCQVFPCQMKQCI